MGVGVRTSTISQSRRVFNPIWGDQQNPLQPEKPPNRGGCDIAGTEGELSLLEEIVEIGPNVVRGELIGRSPMGLPPVVLG
jgi:hypothetical protein